MQISSSLYARVIVLVPKANYTPCLETSNEMFMFALSSAFDIKKHFEKKGGKKKELASLRMSFLGNVNGI